VGVRGVTRTLADADARHSHSREMRRQPTRCAGCRRIISWWSSCDRGAAIATPLADSCQARCTSRCVPTPAKDCGSRTHQRLRLLPNVRCQTEVPGTGVVNPAYQRGRSNGAPKETKMNRLLCAGLSALTMSCACSSAPAAVLIRVDKATQQVSVDGETRYVWPASTGKRGHETPSGSFRNALASRRCSPVR
jgi:hypothetical protein